MALNTLDHYILKLVVIAFILYYLDNSIFDILVFSLVFNDIV